MREKYWRLTQTRLDDEAFAWLEKFARERSLSTAAALRLIVQDRQKGDPKELDYKALEDRLADRIRELEIRVTALEP